MKCYLTDIGTFEEEVLRRFTEALPADRAERISKMRNRNDRLLSVAAGTLLAVALKEYLAEPSADDSLNVEFPVVNPVTVDLSKVNPDVLPPREKLLSTEREGGKPFLPAYPDFHYNLSHSGTKVLLAVSDDEIGCDIQKITDCRERIVRRCFTDTEKGYINETDDAKMRAERFAEIWAAKESYVKETGVGIRTEFCSFAVRDADGTWKVSAGGRELIPVAVGEGCRAFVCRKKKRNLRRNTMNFDAIREYLDSLNGKYGIPQADCMIMRDHKTLFRHSFGTTGRRGEETTPISEKSRYLVFSMTKIQTMTAVMQLVEQGRLSLDDEVAKYLPAYANICVAEEKEDTIRIAPAKRPMLIRHLLSMQSGLDYNLDRPGIRQAVAEFGPKASTRQVVDGFVKTPLCFHPGEHFLYSLSHDVAAAVVEVVTGMSFGEYLKKYIWKPLGMKGTRFFKKNDDRRNLVQQYAFENDRIVPMELDCCYRLSDAYESGGAGLVSITEDYAKLADALACGGTAANGAVILKPETIDVIRTNMLSEQSLKDMHNSMGRFEYGYGYGMQVLMKPELVGSPAPAGVFGWDGAAGSCTIMDPSTKTSLVFMMHVRGFGPAYSEIHPRLRDLMFE